MSEFKLPDVGEGLSEAEIVTWRVSVGDTVEVNDVLVDIETAKSIVELPSPYAGTVTALMASEGDTVAVGTPIIAIGDPAVRPAPSGPTGESAPSVAPERAGTHEVLVGYGPREPSGARRRRRRPGRVASVDSERVPQRPVVALAKPPVRKLARDLGIDLREVPAAGAVVTRAEVEAFARGGAEPTPVASRPAPSVEDVRVPIRGVRKHTAAAMVASAFTAPHVTEWVTVDVSRTVELVDRFRGDRRFDGVSLTATAVVAKAACLALRRTPELNATWDESAQEIVLKGAVNLGVAAATDRGLLVPVIADAGSMGLPELARALADVVTEAREGRTPPERMSGGTFTLTNVGVFGVDAGTPILNPGQTGILALGAIQRRPWVDVEDRVVPAWVTTIALSFDHRVVDGEQGSRFLADIAAILQDPGVGLMY